MIRYIFILLLLTSCTKKYCWQCETQPTKQPKQVLTVCDQTEAQIKNSGILWECKKIK